MDYFVLKDNYKKIAGVKSVLKKGLADTKVTPLVSVAIPTYKRPQLLKETLNSVLNQENFTNYEIIIVDNDPQPHNETEGLVKNYNDRRIFYYKNSKNLGMVGNWNRAIELCRSRWITILHDDDALHPAFLSTMYEAACKYDPDLLSCYCNFDENVWFPDIRLHKPYKINAINLSKCLLTNISPFPGILFKKNIALEMGGFNDEYFPIADYVFWTNCCMRYKCCVLEVILAFYRVGATTTSSKVYIDLINRSYSFKEDLKQRIHLPGILKKVLLDVGMRILIGGYLKYDTERLITNESDYNAPGINNLLVRKAYGAAFKGLSQVTRVV